MITYKDRFYQAAKWLSGNNPEITYEMCCEWLDTDSEELQDAILNSPVVNSLDWVQGIALIDACRVIADHPEEGRHGEIDYEQP